MNKLKRTLFEAALSYGTVSVTVIVAPGLDLPAVHMADGTVLEYGDNMVKPIPDLETTDEGISATLSFANQSVKTFVPWSAIVRMRQEGKFITLFQIDVDELARIPRVVA